MTTRQVLSLAHQAHPLVSSATLGIPNLAHSAKKRKCLTCKRTCDIPKRCSN